VKGKITFTDVNDPANVITNDIVGESVAALNFIWPTKGGDYKVKVDLVEDGPVTTTKTSTTDNKQAPTGGTAEPGSPASPLSVLLVLVFLASGAAGIGLIRRSVVPGSRVEGIGGS